MRRVTAALVLGLLLACSPGEPQPAPPAAEQETAGEAAAAAEPRPAPAFALASLDGELVRSSDFQGKIVVIDFWATWCPPCEFQVPELNHFREAHAGEDDVVVLGISVDVDGDDLVREWVEKKGVEYRVLVGGEELARRFGALGFPTLYVIGPDGQIAMEHVGLIEVADLEQALARLRGVAGS